MNTKDIIEVKFNDYLTKKNIDYSELSFGRKTDISMFSLSFFIAIFLFSSIILSSQLVMGEKLDDNLKFVIMLLSIPITIFGTYFISQKIASKYLSKKAKKMKPENFKEILKAKFYNEFTDSLVDSEILDHLKLKYSAEHFETLILSSKNKTPTYSEVIVFNEKYELLEDSKYKVDIKNIKKEKILNLA